MKVQSFLSARLWINLSIMLSFVLEGTVPMLSPNDDEEFVVR